MDFPTTKISSETAGWKTDPRKAAENRCLPKLEVAVIKMGKVDKVKETLGKQWRFSEGFCLSNADIVYITVWGNGETKNCGTSIL